MLKIPDEDGNIFIFTAEGSEVRVDGDGDTITFDRDVFKSMLMRLLQMINKEIADE